MTDYKETINRIKKTIESKTSEVISIRELAEDFEMNVKTLQNYFSLYEGISPKEYINRTKLLYLNTIIREENGCNKVFYYAHMLGYRSESSLGSFIKRQTGMKFREYCSHIVNNS